MQGFSIRDFVADTVRDSIADTSAIHAGGKAQVHENIPFSAVMKNLAGIEDAVRIERLLHLSHQIHRSP
ncbi:hypothetical protein RHECNPAF_221002 [Rhizobium etli CNPAF512]|nr:hypothetical protein RHECNPAF_221002 [Rhizobium etli CNPAF512]